MDLEKPSLNQIGSLIQHIRLDPHIISHWSVEFEDWHKALDNITIRQYKYILALWFNHKYLQLNKMLESLNLPRKK